MKEISYGRRLWRLVRIVMWMKMGVFICVREQLLNGKHWYCTEKGKHHIQVWLIELARRMRINARHHGEVESQPHVQVANHVSWLDIVVLGAKHPLNFVAKAEIENWPVVGLLARSSGTCFLKRGSVSSLRALIPAFQRNYEKGNSIAVFPEGTTTDGNQVAPFHAALFQIMIDAEIPVQPVYINYSGNEKQRRKVAYIENDRFLSHLWDLTACPQIDVDVHYLGTKTSKNRQRRLLARACEIDIMMEHIRQNDSTFKQVA